MSRFASLTAGLLARKGQAEPVTTPFADQLLTRVGTPSEDIRALTPMPHGHPASKAKALKPVEPAGSFLGTFGKRLPHETDRLQDLPPVAPVLHEEEENADNHCGSCIGQPLDDPGKTFHVNLRLKRTRFVKLKLSAALLRRPVQDVVGEALDQWFDKLPAEVMGDCACLRSHPD